MRDYGGRGYAGTMRKSIAVDFANQVICIMMEGQQETEQIPDVKKEDFISFFPDKKYMAYDSFTWNFGDGTFTVNQNYNLKPGGIMTKDCFLPEMIIPFRDIKKKYREFIRALGMEEKQDIFPPERRKFLGR